MYSEKVIFSQSFKKNLQCFIVLSFISMLMLTPLNAQESDAMNACTTLNAILGLLKGASIVIVTLAIMWAGYKFLFARAEISECGKILAAGILIGSATSIAGLIMTGKAEEQQCKTTAMNSVAPTTEFAYASPVSDMLARFINEA